MPHDSTAMDEDRGTGARPRRTRRLVTLSMLIILGLTLTGGADLALSGELTRHATGAEASAAAQQEWATRWQRLSAGQIFPSSISYQDYGGDALQASRVGIGQPASCTIAFDPAAARTLSQVGCLTTLRATYMDTTGTLAATVAVAVLRNPAAAQSAMSRIRARYLGAIRAVTFPGTIASQFSDPAREVTGQAEDGRYLVFYAAGYADGRHTAPDTFTGDVAPSDLGTSLLNHVDATFSESGSPCQLRDIRC